VSNISAAIGVAQLEKIDDLIAMKAAIYDRYRKAFERYADYGVEMMHVPDSCTSNYWLSVLYLGDNSFVKPESVVNMLKNENIEARHVWKPMHTQRLWEGCDFVYVMEEPHSEDFFEHAVCLPSDVNMTEEEQSRVIALIREYIEWTLRLYCRHGN
jgi:dTDP-4-amino-4,6-dideoxygalactose transaminase